MIVDPTQAGAHSRFGSPLDSLPRQRAALHARYREEYPTLPHAAQGRWAERLLREETALVDRHLRACWQRCGLARKAVVLYALGGYGRRALFPGSDVDLLILRADPPTATCDGQVVGEGAAVCRAGVLSSGEATNDAALERAIEHFLHQGWDSGLRLSHSVRTLSQALAAARDDLAFETALLDRRMLTGRAALRGAFDAGWQAQFQPARFVSAKLAEQALRHAREELGQLEPNLKEARGGLRDLHLLGWVMRLAREATRQQASSLRQMPVQKTEQRLLRAAGRSLTLLRVWLHLLAGRGEDRLCFEYQPGLAVCLGLLPSSARSVTGGAAQSIDAPHPDRRQASERVMARYFTAERWVMQLQPVLLDALCVHWRTHWSAEESRVRRINARFVLRDGQIALAHPDVYREDPHAILETFTLFGSHELREVAPETLRALWHARGQVNAAFRRDAENHTRFLTLLRAPSGVYHALRTMNQHGLLGRYLPAFGRIVGQMQYDLYHCYTVDEHILRVVRELRRFTHAECAHENPLCAQRMAAFAQPELLYLAALFHDIAKGQGGDHSRLGARAARRFCRAQGLDESGTALVAWLVAEHLNFSLTAQKEDLDDPATIARFAARVGTPMRLDALYLLTVADIRATNPAVWSHWKAQLLEMLYLATHTYLHGGDTSARPITARDRHDACQAKARMLLQRAGLAVDVARDFWKTLEPAYFLRHGVADIAWHARCLHDTFQADRVQVWARALPREAGIQVLIYLHDRPALFADLCDFFTRQHYSVLQAQINTTRRAYALDHFVITPLATAPRRRATVLSQQIFTEPEAVVLDTAAGSHHPAEPGDAARDRVAYIEYELTRQLTLSPLAAGAFSGGLSPAETVCATGPHAAGISLAANRFGTGKLPGAGSAPQGDRLQPDAMNGGGSPTRFWQGREETLARASRYWRSRALRHIGVETTVVLLPGTEPHHYTLMLNTGDTPGLLARVARVFLTCGITLHTARIMTLGDRVEDSFSIHSEKLSDPQWQLMLREQLLVIARG